MKEWGLFVVAFGAFLLMISPIQDVGIAGGLVFIVVGIVLYQRGRHHESK